MLKQLLNARNARAATNLARLLSRDVGLPRDEKTVQNPACGNPEIPKWMQWSFDLK